MRKLCMGMPGHLSDRLISPELSVCVDVTLLVPPLLYSQVTSLSQSKGATATPPLEPSTP